MLPKQEMWVRFPSPALKKIMRLSDILKKTGKKTPASPAGRPDSPPDLRKENPTPEPEIQFPEHEKARIAHASVEKIPVLAPEEVYNRAITEAKSLVEHIENKTPYTGRIESVQEIIELVEDNNGDITILADKATPDLYLYSHMVNVCIFSLILGNQAGFRGQALKELGYCAFLHDIGLVRNIPLIIKKGKLTPAEFNLVKQHSQSGSELVPLAAGLAPEIRESAGNTILQVHERVDGKGYPLGIRGKDISQFAKTIAVADVYEALTHPRPYRDRFIPHEALKMMITSADSDFDTVILKAFIEKISLYPPGSYVRLNSEEVAKVIRMNPGMPTRPAVKVLVSPKGIRVAENKVIDLSNTPMLFIKEPVDETKMELSDKRLALELKAVRWWVKGL